MKILSPVLREVTTGRAWWRTPIFDQEAVDAGESSFRTTEDLCKDYPETGNVVQLWAKPLSLNSLREYAVYPDDDFAS